MWCMHVFVYSVYFVYDTRLRFLNLIVQQVATDSCLALCIAPVHASNDNSFCQMMLDWWHVETFVT